MMHPRNRHTGRYDFEQLTGGFPDLKPFVSRNQHGDLSIDFADPAAVKALNAALLKQFYGLSKWNIPDGYLCPPIPGRADYVHHLADLLDPSSAGNAVRVLDIGVGANCIYPIVGHCEYQWSFVGSDTDPVALESAKKIVESNPQLGGAIELRLQESTSEIFRGIVLDEDFFDLSICNPPFHASPEEAQAGSDRKWKNLGRAPRLNFGGQASELWYPGGEMVFVRLMIEESADIPKNILWFSTLISKELNLPGVYRALKRAKAVDVKTIDMSQGQKKSRIVAWTFMSPAEQKAWRRDIKSVRSAFLTGSSIF